MEYYTAVNFLLNTTNPEIEQTNNEDIKFLKIIYDDIDQLMRWLNLTKILSIQFENYISQMFLYN
jgi:hypothetical protein